MIIPNLALKADAVAIKVSKEKDLMANIFFDFCCKVVQLQLQNLLRSSKYSCVSRCKCGRRHLWVIDCRLYKESNMIEESTEKNYDQKKSATSDKCEDSKYTADEKWSESDSKNPQSSVNEASSCISEAVQKRIQYNSTNTFKATHTIDNPNLGEIFYW